MGLWWTLKSRLADLADSTAARSEMGFAGAGDVVLLEEDESDGEDFVFEGPWHEVFDASVSSTMRDGFRGVEYFLPPPAVHIIDFLELSLHAQSTEIPVFFFDTVRHARLFDERFSQLVVVVFERMQQAVGLSWVKNAMLR
eukprot:CAMPEP_0119324584 /NCGR_PEP_ID=MMETSP1333-20130426/63646_1 /TAXON_ID=418940 /ORGANISM="Scyphosphaera apsteinii, Strain RCC1455" /LENGTH=140 /DNA_ID=CAMNT_0007332323 /DNA_START=168 /DNA_END=586 /DNA_ORIENTATION=+